MAAGTYNFIVDQGASIVRTFRILDIDGNLVPFPAGSQAVMSIKSGIGTTGANLLLMRSDSSGLALDLTGIITISLTSDQTENTLFGYDGLVYDLFVQSPNSTSKILTGNITIVPSITAL